MKISALVRTFPMWVRITVSLIVLAAVVFALWSFDPFGRRKRAENRAATAEQQEAIATGTGKALEKTLTKEAETRKEAEDAADEIEAAPGANEKIPPGVLDRWRRGIDGVRDGKGEPTRPRVAP
jgi:hypothetical protein